MKTYILDTNVILKNPEVLSIEQKGIKLVIPSIVLNELKFRGNRGHQWKRLYELLEEAIARNLVELSNIEDVDSIFTHKRGLDHQDALIATLLKRLSVQTEAILVTEDRLLKEACLNNSLDAIGIFQFIQDVSSQQSKVIPASSTNDKMREEITKFDRKSKFNIFLNVFAAICISFLTFLFIYNINDLVQRVHPVLLIISITILSVSVYYFRSHLKLGYGLVEFIVGLVVCIYTLFPMFDFQFYNHSTANGTIFIPFLGAFFITIRGLDNIGNGISESVILENTKFKTGWDTVFKKRKMEVVSVQA